MKTFAIVLTIILSSPMLIPVEDNTIYTFELDNIDGDTIRLDKYQGKVLLIVNTASKCGYTPQYEGLQAIYETYKGDGLVVLGFPANNFGGQEPGTNQQIKQFCRVNYDVGFPMFSKISVKGSDIEPLFEYLTSAQNPDFTGEIKWNFEKFLIDRSGNLARRFRSAVEPESSELTSAIEELLER